MRMTFLRSSCGQMSAGTGSNGRPGRLAASGRRATYTAGAPAFLCSAQAYNAAATLRGQPRTHPPARPPARTHNTHGHQPSGPPPPGRRSPLCPRRARWTRAPPGPWRRRQGGTDPRRCPCARASANTRAGPGAPSGRPRTQGLRPGAPLRAGIAVNMGASGRHTWHPVCTALEAVRVPTCPVHPAARRRRNGRASCCRWAAAATCGQQCRRRHNSFGPSSSSRRTNTPTSAMSPLPSPHPLLSASPFPTQHPNLQIQVHFWTGHGSPCGHPHGLPTVGSHVQSGSDLT